MINDIRYKYFITFKSVAYYLDKVRRLRYEEVAIAAVRKLQVLLICILYSFRVQISNLTYYFWVFYFVGS